MAEAEIALIDQPAAPHNQQSAVLRARLGGVKRVVKFLRVNPRGATDVLRRLERPPSAGGVGRREIDGGVDGISCQTGRRLQYGSNGERENEEDEVREVK